MRRARGRRTDANQAGIVAALRAVGCSVAVTSHLGHGFPDLVVGRGRTTVLMECKSGPRDGLTEDEVTWHCLWKGGPLVIVRTPAEALAAVGITVGER